MLEPVGCLAEFPAEPFHEIAVRFFGLARKKPQSKSGSRSYWHLLNLMETSKQAHEQIVALELQAVEEASVYEDVAPAIAELRGMGVKLAMASSLSHAALTQFAEKAGLTELPAWSRDRAGGVKSAPITRAMETLAPEHTVYLTDTAEGLTAARNAGVNSILMMNDPDEAKRLAQRGPAGGIVSLHELPDFVRLLAATSLRP